MSFPCREAESVADKLSVDQSAVASPQWDVLMSHVTVSTASLRLKMCKLACAFVFNLKNQCFCAEAVTVSCNGLLAMEDCYYVAIKGKYQCNFWLSALAIQFRIFQCSRALVCLLLY